VSVAQRNSFAPAAAFIAEQPQPRVTVPARCALVGLSRAVSRRSVSPLTSSTSPNRPIAAFVSARLNGSTLPPSSRMSSSVSGTSR
jgi:hypothetical protein